MGICGPQGSRHQPPDHLGRVRRWEPHPHRGAQGQAGGLAERDRRRIRTVPLHVRPLVRAADELPSLKENDGYFLTREVMGLAVGVRPDRRTRRRHLLRGVGDRRGAERPSAHVISVNEMDPLRDEGLLYYRRLVRAGVPAIGRIVAGTCHGSTCCSAATCPRCSAPAFATSAASRSRWASSIVAHLSHVITARPHRCSVHKSAKASQVDARMPTSERQIRRPTTHPSLWPKHSLRGWHEEVS